MSTVSELRNLITIKQPPIPKKYNEKTTIAFDAERYNLPEARIVLVEAMENIIKNVVFKEDFDNIIKNKGAEHIGVFSDDIYASAVKVLKRNFERGFVDGKLLILEFKKPNFEFKTGNSIFNKTINFYKKRGLELKAEKDKKAREEETKIFLKSNQKKNDRFKKEENEGKKAEETQIKKEIAKIIEKLKDKITDENLSFLKTGSSIQLKNIANGRFARNAGLAQVIKRVLGLNIKTKLTKQQDLIVSKKENVEFKKDAFKNGMLLKFYKRQSKIGQLIYDGKEQMLIVHGTGCGKTYGALSGALAFLQKNKKGIVIIICLPAVKQQWKNEFIEFGLTIEQVTSKFLFMTFQEWVTRGKKEYCKDELLIIDEAHTLANMNGVRFREAYKCAESAKQRILLTATPFRNSLEDLVPLANLMYGKYVIGVGAEKKNWREDLREMKDDKKKDAVEAKIYKLAEQEVIREKMGKNATSSEISKKYKEIIERGSYEDKLGFGASKPLLGYIKTHARGMYAIEKTAMMKIMKAFDGNIDYIASCGGGADFPETKTIYKDFVMSNEFFEEYKELASTPHEEPNPSKGEFKNPRAFYNGWRRLTNTKLGSEKNQKIEYIMNNLKNNLFTKKNKYYKAVIYTTWLTAGVEFLKKSIKKNGLDKFISIYSGSVSNKKEELEKFNGTSKNNYLDFKTRIMIITKSASTGVTFKGVQDMFIMDAVWNDADLQQLKGRVARSKSHTFLPKQYQSVNYHFLILHDTAKIQKAFIKTRKYFYDKADKIIQDVGKDIPQKDRDELSKNSIELQKTISGDTILYRIAFIKRLATEKLLRFFETTDIDLKKQLFEDIHAIDKNFLSRFKPEDESEIRDIDEAIPQIRNLELYKSYMEVENFSGSSNERSFTDADLKKISKFIKISDENDLYETPSNISETIYHDFIQEHRHKKNIRLLEPTAGFGSLVIPFFQHKNIKMDLVEYAEGTSAELKKIKLTGITIHGNTDFFEYKPTKKYTVIISNPPFSSKAFSSPNSSGVFGEKAKDGYMAMLIKMLYHLDDNGVLYFISIKSFFKDKNNTGFYEIDDKLFKGKLGDILRRNNYNPNIINKYNIRTLGGVTGFKKIPEGKKKPQAIFTNNTQAVQLFKFTQKN